MVVDEAYVDFGAESARCRWSRATTICWSSRPCPSRALAGLRVGFAIGQRPLIEALERVKDSFNSYPLDCFAIAGAVAAIEDDTWFQETRRRIMREPRDAGRAASPSWASRCCRHRRTSCSRAMPAIAAPISQRELRERGVLVRHFQKPRIEDFLRITVGTDDECGRLIDLLRQTGLIATQRSTRRQRGCGSQHHVRACTALPVILMPSPAVSFANCAIDRALRCTSNAASSW